ncbi:MAG: phage protease [Prevotella sp.]|nr:phage protease [Prevotella sp.]
MESKWENGFLRMASAALEPLATSSDPALVMEGQIRETVTRCKLIEVSIVDIGGNDEALQLYGGEKLLKLAAGEESPALPLLTLTAEGEKHETEDKPETPITNNEKKMTKEQLTLLGLPEGASDEQVTAALNLMKQKADSVETLQLAALTKAVDQAIADRKIVAEQRDHFIKLGKSAGIEMLADTFKAMTPQAKPTDVINLSNGTNPTPAGGAAPKSYMKLSDVPHDELLALRKDNPGEYMRLYKEEYGVDCPKLED